MNEWKRYNKLLTGNIYTNIFVKLFVAKVKNSVDQDFKTKYVHFQIIQVKCINTQFACIFKLLIDR